MGHYAIFLDRDGTINEDPGYLGDPDKVKIFPETGKALSEFKNQLHFKLIVISNQSGIARGFIRKEDVELIHLRINELLAPYNVSIDAFYYCPHHPDFDSGEECSCRKPSPALIFRASKEYNIDLSRSYFIGDTPGDIQCGLNAGLKTILVRTGYGEESFSILQKENKMPTFVADNLLGACDFVKKDIKGENN